jgi:hypothetical protein
LPAILPRLRKAVVAGQTFEFDPEIEELESSVERTLAEQATSSQLPTQGPEKPLPDPDAQLLEIASRDRRLGIVAIGVELERALRALAGQLGIERASVLLLGRLVEALVRHGALGLSATSSFELFWKARNRIIHSAPGGLEEAEAVTVIDVGLSLLKLVRAVPHETYRVVAMAPVYKDPDGQIERSGIRGVILEVESEGGTSKQRRVYPTTRDYRPATLVTWAWNLAREIGESWYLNPETARVEYGWTKSGEFAGDELPER